MGKESISATAFSEQARDMFEQTVLQLQAREAVKGIAGSTQFGGSEAASVTVPGQQRDGHGGGIA